MAMLPRNQGGYFADPTEKPRVAQTNGQTVKKKLLYLALCDPDLEVTGATVRMGAFVRHLSRYYDVTLVNMGGSGYRVEPAVEDRCRDRHNRLGVKERIRIDFSRSGYFLFSTALYRAAAALLKRHAYDYLLADYGLAAIYGARLSRRYGVPLIYSSHNVEYRMYWDLSRRDFRRGILAPYVYWAERAACAVAKLIVTISENDRSHYARWVSSDRVAVIPQGFDPKRANPFYEPPAAAPPVVLFVGSFRGENNRRAGRLIVKKIAPAVLRQRPDVKFQLIGADPASDWPGANVECPGFVDDLGPYLQRANLVIAPMHFAHGMATKIVLALAFGKTVLATAEAAAGIGLAQRQLVVAPENVFAQRIVQLLDTRPSIDDSGFTALCDEFAWPNLIARLARRIEERCAENTPDAKGAEPWS